MRIDTDNIVYYICPPYTHVTPYLSEFNCLRLQERRFLHRYMRKMAGGSVVPVKQSAKKQRNAGKIVLKSLKCCGGQSKTVVCTNCGNFFHASCAGRLTYLKVAGSGFITCCSGENGGDGAGFGNTNTNVSIDADAVENFNESNCASEIGDENNPDGDNMILRSTAEVDTALEMVALRGKLDRAECEISYLKEIKI